MQRHFRFLYSCIRVYSAVAPGNLLVRVQAVLARTVVTVHTFVNLPYPRVQFPSRVHIQSTLARLIEASNSISSYKNHLEPHYFQSWECYR